MNNLTRLALLFALSMFLTLSAAGQKAMHSGSVGSSGTSQDQPSPCPVTPTDLSTITPGVAHDACLFYPAVGASYVGGTILGMPLKKGFGGPGGFYSSGLLRDLGLFKRQYRVRGRVALGMLNFVFIFKTGGRPNLPHGSQYQLLSCDSHVNPPGSQLSNAAEQACDDFGAGNKQKWEVIEIPFDKIIVLARAKVPSSDLASIAAAYGTAATGVLSSVISALGKTHAKELYGGITAGGLALGYYFLIARPRSADNYIALFVCPPGQTCHNSQISMSSPSTIQNEIDTNQKDKSSKLTKTFSPNGLFKEGDVIMFKIPNTHDYYNISMILSGKTGKEFAPETVEKIGK